MTEGTRTFAQGELRRRVDEVLYYVWDPIGVADQPYARAEYESYVPKVLELVEKNDDIAPISAYLMELDVYLLGSSPSNKEKHKEKSDQVAELLLEHKNAIEEGCA